MYLHVLGLSVRTGPSFFIQVAEVSRFAIAS